MFDDWRQVLLRKTCHFSVTIGAAILKGFENLLPLGDTEIIDRGRGFACTATILGCLGYLRMSFFIRARCTTDMYAMAYIILWRIEATLRTNVLCMLTSILQHIRGNGIFLYEAIVLFILANFLTMKCSIFP